MDEKGVYAIARSLWECEAFTRQKYTQREAWMWLIGAAVWKQTRINLDGKRVLLERGEFAFSLRFLAVKWKWSKDSVSRFFLLLKNEDMIRDTQRDGHRVFSILKYNEFQVVGLPKRDTECDDDRDARETPPRQPRDKEETLQTLETLEVPEEGAPKGAVVLPISSKPVLPDWLPKEAWAGFCEMRRKARKPLTPRAQDLILSKLDRWRMAGHDPGAILDSSTANGWTGIFEPKAERNGQRKSPHETAYSVARDYCAEILASGQGAEGGGVDETALALLPAGPNGSPNQGRH